MFAAAKAFNRDISGWNVLSAAKFADMFADPTGLDNCNRKRIYDAWSKQLQAAYPSWSNAGCNLCELVRSNVSLTSSVSQGMTSHITVRIDSKLPTGTLLGELQASPQGSFAPAPFATGRVVAAELTQTGKWMPFFTLSSRNRTDRCDLPVQTVGCMPSFVDVNGQCRCPNGYENFDGNCTRIRTVCDVAHVRVDGASVSPTAHANLTDRSNLSIGFSDGRDATDVSVQMRLRTNVTTVPAPNASDLLSPGQVATGEYEIWLAVGGTSCILFPAVGVGCDTANGYRTEAGIGTRCVSAQCVGDEWADPFSGRCRQKAEMAARASSTTLEMTLFKSNTSMTISYPIELRLKSGSIDADLRHRIEWRATWPSGWLSVDRASGTVYSSAPVAEIIAIANGSGLNDTARSGPVITSITFNSSATAMTSSDFVKGTNVQTIAVRLTINANIYLEADDVQLLSTDGAPIERGSVEASTDLRVNVYTRDCERRPIQRPDQNIVVWLQGSSVVTQTFIMKPGSDEHLWYTVVVLASELTHTGEYIIRVTAQRSGSVHQLEFRINDRSRFKLIFGATSAAVLGVLLIALLVFVRRSRERVKDVVKSFFKMELRAAAELLVDAWDIYGA
jgi:hypothetical protein